MKGPLARSGIEGPTYADRVGGLLTFRDWDHWTAEDQDEYREEFIARAPKSVIFAFHKTLGLIDERFS